MKPLIGITTGTIYAGEHAGTVFKYGQGHAYSDAITMAGGVPVLIPIATSREATAEIFECLDGIVFAGGNDLEPGLYNSEATLAREADMPRDTHEVELMRMALAAHKPVLAICRGMQLLNVVRGGTLYQDIMQEIPGAHNHDGNHADVPKPYTHPLSITKGTYLESLLQTLDVQSNSFHHQAVKDLGKGLIINARADDDIIEGVEDMSEGYVLALQAHPESMAVKGRLEWQRVFESFVQASQHNTQTNNTTYGRSGVLSTQPFAD